MKQRLGECEECIFIQLPGLPSTIYIKSSRLGSYICRVSRSCSSTAAEISDPPFSPLTESWNMVSVKCPHILSQKYLGVVWGFRLRRFTSGRRRCEAAERRRFHSPCAGFCDARGSPTGHVSISGTQWRLIYFHCALYFATPLNQTHSSILASRYNPICLLLDLDPAFFLSLSCVLRDGTQRLCWMWATAHTENDLRHVSIHPWFRWVGCGWVGTELGFFSATLSKQNKQISMSAYCSEGKQLTVTAAGWLNTIRND